MQHTPHHVQTEGVRLRGRADVAAAATQGDPTRGSSSTTATRCTCSDDRDDTRASQRLQRAGVTRAAEGDSSACPSGGGTRLQGRAPRPSRHDAHSLAAETLASSASQTEGGVNREAQSTRASRRVQILTRPSIVSRVAVEMRVAPRCVSPPAVAPVARARCCSPS